MLDHMFNLSLLMFIQSLMMFSYFYKHILLTLVSLEFMMLNLLFNIYISLLSTNLNMFFMSLFLTIMICESILGMSLLIYLVRYNGNDYLKTLNLIKW
uniref:NADH-ubiquinone oxidoreductase chain 4L n=1 Tax=Zele chlorophthalmus TaxID=1080924 RepID=A0A345X0P9_ZELCH|nr:NADH dehydrogenase subunit 4L [Zele chlorophthalmus]AXK15291.1 NADH dehydrogenase subunit 4L [Zele chlorophthalmus]